MGRPTQHTFPLSSFFGGRAIRVRYAIPEPHTPRGAGCGSPGPRGGGHSGRDTPGPSFPNPEAKTASADGTAPARVWESRTPPPTPQEKGGGRPAAPPSCLPPAFSPPAPHARDHGQPPAPADAAAADAADNHHTARRRHRQRCGRRRAQRDPSHKHRPPNNQHTNHSFSRLCATNPPRSALSNRRCVQQTIRMSCPVA